MVVQIQRAEVHLPDDAEAFALEGLADGGLGKGAAVAGTGDLIEFGDEVGWKAEVGGDTLAGGPGRSRLQPARVPTRPSRGPRFARPVVDADDVDR